jgi:hypothetical protein
MSPLRLLHLSWCRTEEELLQKLTNWGHSKDYDTGKFLEMWRNTNLENYQQLKNFHPLHGPLWPFLGVIDWPPTSLFDPRQATGGTTPPRDNRIIELGRTASGGVAISFGVPATGGKDIAG